MEPAYTPSYQHGQGGFPSFNPPCKSHHFLQMKALKEERVIMKEMKKVLHLANIPTNLLPKSTKEKVLI